MPDKTILCTEGPQNFVERCRMQKNEGVKGLNSSKHFFWNWKVQWILTLLIPYLYLNQADIYWTLIAPVWLVSPHVFAIHLTGLINTGTALAALLMLVPPMLPTLALDGLASGVKTLQKKRRYIKFGIVLFPITLYVVSVTLSWVFRLVGSFLLLPIPIVSLIQYRRFQVLDRAIAASPASKTSESPLKLNITSGYDVAGENLKIAVKVANEDSLTISNVMVTLDTPDGLEFIQNSEVAQRVGTITGGGFQSAIFWLKPTRCIDDEYGGHVSFRDAFNESHVAEIPKKRLVNVCPLLAPVEDPSKLVLVLKSDSLSRNCSSYQFSGKPEIVFSLAEARLRGLQSLDRSEQTFEDGVYLGYTSYLGKTKYGEKKFAAEILVSGTIEGGTLTITVYSDDERILSGFFVDVMENVREHIEVLEERTCPVATCPKCGGNLAFDDITEDRIYRCSFCGVVGKAPPWLSAGEMQRIQEKKQKEVDSSIEKWKERLQK